MPASAGMPAAPISVRAALRNRARASGRRLSASASSARLAGALHLAAPVDVDEERAVVHGDLRRPAAPVAGDVAGGHRDEVRRDAEVVQRLHDAGRTEQVHLDGGVERGVERHGGRGVDDDVARRERRPTRVVEGEAVGGDVAGDGRDALRHHRREAVLAELLAQAVEGVVAEDLPLGPLLDGGATAGPDEQDELAAGHAAQQPLDQGGPQEAGASGDRDALAVQSLRDHPPLSTIW